MLLFKRRFVMPNVFKAERRGAAIKKGINLESVAKQAKLPYTIRKASILLSMVLIMLSGCATKMPDPEIKYSSIITGDFNARSGQAKISKESEDFLRENGYIKIGSVRAVVPVKHCKGGGSDHCQTSSRVMDATTAVLERAAAQGGDLVVLSIDKEEKSSVTYEKVRTAGTTADAIYYNLNDPNSKYWKPHKEFYDYRSSTVFYHLSEGAVWRQVLDPGEIVKALLSGSDVNAKDGTGKTALIIAAESAPDEVVKALLTHGVDVNAKDKAGMTALMSAKSSAAVKALLASGADAKGIYGVPALRVAAINGDHEVFKALLARGADINAAKNDALVLAAEGGHTAMVNVLLARGAELNSKDGYGRTALMTASQNGNMDVVKLLLDRNADVNSKNSFGETALIYASKGENIDVVKALLARGAKVNDKNNTNWTPLMVASMRGNNKITKELLTHGADVNAKSQLGMTALMNAVDDGYVETVDILLSHGADVNAKNNFGWTALSMGQRKLKEKKEYDRYVQIIELLRKAGAKE
jgi:ankyrin repeat protein